ncbi:MAG: 3D domain-containing protein [Actinomycetota bacterium]|nr:3D domain-containing protein [Actinomycetota bacterium]
MRGARACLVTSAALLAGLAAGCGSSGSHRPRSSDPSAARASPRTAVAVVRRPPEVALRIELPLIGLSSASTVRYSTSTGRAALRGAVTPANATVYMLDPEGNRTAVNPGAAGVFSVRAKLTPGENTFQFTAAVLGAQARNQSLDVTWRGPAAAARQRAMNADPAKYLPPASAGLNRKIPRLPSTPKLASGSVTVSFSLNPINAPAPPPRGGNGKWLGGFELTEYYPALEAWFVGAPVRAAGLSAPHRIDWLYSARGLSMEGDGVGLDGRQYHVANLGSGGWLTAGGGQGAKFGVGSSAPYWRTGGFWRAASGLLTFPLDNGGWSDGVGARYVPPPGITFAPGQSRPLAYLRSVAVDPRLIPFGSHIYIPAYRSVNGGWFEADDTGGAIIGRHIDVFRPPPSNPADTGNFATGQTVYIVAPGQPLP